jgi:hypothetical protein
MLDELWVAACAVKNHDMIMVLMTHGSRTSISHREAASITAQFPEAGLSEDDLKDRDKLERGIPLDSLRQTGTTQSGERHGTTARDRWARCA